MYRYKENYVLDFSSVKYLGEVHRIIKDELDFPDYYGENWSAFWDCLTDMIDDPLHIRLVGFEVIQREFPFDADIMLNTLKDLKHIYEDSYASRIKIEIVCGEAKYEIN